MTFHFRFVIGCVVESIIADQIKLPDQLLRRRDCMDGALGVSEANDALQITNRQSHK